MRALLTATMAVLVAVNVYGQGQITFTTVPNGVIENGLTGMPVAGADGIMAQIYWSEVGMDNFASVGTPVSVGTVLPGHALGGVLTLGVTAGSMVDLQVRAWEASFGATYEDALAAPPVGGRGALNGSSGTFTVATGGPTSPPSPPTSIGAASLPFTITAVPEPSIVALSLIGAGALLLLRRRR